MSPEIQRLQKQVEWEALTRHSCGERLRGPDSRSAFRDGDIVYHTPRHPVSEIEMQHCVALITHVHTRCIAESDDRLPTGQLTLFRWNTTTRGFAKGMIKTDYGGDCDWTLFPPCCGRGAACPQLALTLPSERQWPNGAPLDVRELETIPEAFLAWIIVYCTKWPCWTWRPTAPKRENAPPVARVSLEDPARLSRSAQCYANAPHRTNTSSETD